jgi:hypothetical protein
MLPKINYQPYYIYAPYYRSSSAGIKALYILSHNLNLRGYKSYIILDENTIEYKEHDALFYNLNISFLDQELLKFHHDNGFKPITIYSDTVTNNPLQAKNIVRYMMNYNGLFVDLQKEKDEFTIAYSKKLSESLNLPDNRVLFIPTSNTDIFYPANPELERSGTCVYMGKYFDYHKGKPCSLVKNSTVITRISGTITPNQIADLFRKSELLYLYENSAIATEAVLCGCPVVFIPNKFLKEEEVNLSQNELGLAGYGISTNPQSIEDAKRNVRIGRENYFKSFEIFEKQLESFIKITQEHFSHNNIESQHLVNYRYFHEKNPLPKIISKKLNCDDMVILNDEDFKETIKNLDTFYPKRQFTKKIKLINSNERFLIKYNISIKFKRFNFGRILKKVQKK